MYCKVCLHPNETRLFDPFSFQYKNKYIDILLRFKIVYSLFAICHVARLSDAKNNRHDLSIKAARTPGPCR